MVYRNDELTTLRVIIGNPRLIPIRSSLSIVSESTVGYRRCLHVSLL
jgi:hypothetical protein